MANVYLSADPAGGDLLGTHIPVEGYEDLFKTQLEDDGIVIEATVAHETLPWRYYCFRDAWRLNAAKDGADIDLDAAKVAAKNYARRVSRDTIKLFRDRTLLLLANPHTESDLTTDFAALLTNIDNAANVEDLLQVLDAFMVKYNFVIEDIMEFETISGQSIIDPDYPL